MVPAWYVPGYEDVVESFLLQWCEKAELEWIATTLNQAMGLPATQPKPKATTDGWDDGIC